MEGLRCAQAGYARLHITEEKIKKQIRDTGKKRSVDNIEELFRYTLYYSPFYLFRAGGKLERRVFHNLHLETYISVDGIMGYFARVQAPPPGAAFEKDISQRLADGAVLLSPMLNPDDAWDRAVETLRGGSSLSMALWMNRRLEISPLECAIVYKPYWLVEITGPRGGEYTRVIDATSGEVGGQNAYRFLRGFEESIKRSVISHV